VSGEQDYENDPVCRVLSASNTVLIEKLLFLTSFHLWLKNFVVVSKEIVGVSGLIR
jgi:hypothetical protein